MTLEPTVAAERRRRAASGGGRAGNLNRPRVRTFLISLAIVAGLWLTVDPGRADARVLQLGLAAAAMAGATLSIRWPVLALADAGGATAVAWLLGLTADPFLLAGFAAFAVAERQGSRRFPWWLLASAVAVAVLTLGLSAEGIEDRFRAMLLSAAVLAAAWVLGVRTRQVSLEAAARSRAQERLRLVRDVHDVLSHALAGIGVRAGVAAHVATLGEPELREVLREVEVDARESLAQLNVVLHRERDRAGIPAGDAPAGDAPAAVLTAALADLARMAERAGIEASLTVTGDADAVPVTVSTTVQRLAQESVTNVVRHSSASSLVIALSVGSDRLVLTVRDDGRGAAAGLREGHGLTGMRERLELVGGTLQIDAGPPGFSVTASLPLGSAPGHGALS